MTDPSLLDRLVQFIVNNYSSKDFKDLCRRLNVNAVVWAEIPAGERSIRLVDACCEQHCLARLLLLLEQDHPAEFAHCGLGTTPNVIALVEGQAVSRRYADAGRVSSDPSKTAPFSPHAGRTRRRWPLILLIVCALVFVAVVASIWSQPAASFPSTVDTLVGTAPTDEPVPPQELDLSAAPHDPVPAYPFYALVFAGSMALLAGFAQISGFSLRDFFRTEPIRDPAENFPFYVLDTADDLLSLLFPNTVSPVIPDAAIPFIPRTGNTLDCAYEKTGWILISGRSKTGKSREALEVIKRCSHGDAKVLLVKDFVALHPPFAVPASLLAKRFILFFDDIDRYCEDKESIKKVKETIEFFQQICHEPHDLKVIATVRKEPEYWRKIQYENEDLWSQFERVEIPSLDVSAAEELLTYIADTYRFEIPIVTRQEIARRNDGTFLNIIASARMWVQEGLTALDEKQIEDFESNLQKHWGKRYTQLAASFKETSAIYAAANVLQDLNTPLQREFVLQLAADMNARRAFHVATWLRNEPGRWLSYLSQRWLGKVPLYRRIVTAHRSWYYYSFLVLAVMVVLYLAVYAQLYFVPLDLLLSSVDIVGTAGMVVASLVVLLAALYLAIEWYQSRNSGQVDAVINRLLSTEVPFTNGELRPYELQFDVNVTLRSWSVLHYLSKIESKSFTRLMVPKLVRLYCRAAQFLIEKGEITPARSLARRAHDLNPANPLPLYVLGKCAYYADECQDALGYFQRSVQVSRFQDVAAIEDWIGRCYSCLNEHSQASYHGSSPPEIIAVGLHANESVTSRDADNEKETKRKGIGTSQAFDRLAKPGAIRRLLGSVLRLSALALLILLGVLSLVSLPQMTGQAPMTFLGPLFEPDRVPNLLVSAFPGTAYPLIVRGKARLRARQFELAAADFAVAHQLSPKSVRALLDRSVAYRLGGKNNAAVDALNSALTLDASFYAAYVERGLNYRDLGQTDQAVVEFQRAVVLDPNQIWAYVELAATYAKAGNWVLALSEYDALEDLFPESGWGLWGRADVYRKRGRFDLALAEYDQASESFPRQSWSYSNRADIYRQIGKYDQALAEYDKIVQLFPGESTGYSGRASIYQQMGKYDEALAEYDKMIERFPNESWGYSVAPISTSRWASTIRHWRNTTR